MISSKDFTQKDKLKYKATLIVNIHQVFSSITLGPPELGICLRDGPIESDKGK